MEENQLAKSIKDQEKKDSEFLVIMISLVISFFFLFGLYNILGKEKFEVFMLWSGPFTWIWLILAIAFAIRNKLKKAA